MAGGINLYEYVAGDPVNYVDVNGLWSIYAPWTWGDPTPAGHSPWDWNNPQNNWGDIKSSDFGDGALAAADGFIPFGDPFAGLYDQCLLGAPTSTLLGKASGYAAATAASLMAVQAANHVLMPATLYHFTSTSSATGIAAVGGIRAGSGMYGYGVYLTGIKSRLYATIQGAKSTEAVVAVPTAGIRVSATIWPGTYIVRNASVLIR
jgi:hypothetical protein